MHSSMMCHEVNKYSYMKTLNAKTYFLFYKNNIYKKIDAQNR